MDFGMPVLMETPTIAECAALCKALGLQFVELNMNFPWCAQSALDKAPLQALCEEYGLYFTLHLEEQMNPCDLNPLVARAYTDTALAAIGLALKLHMPTVTMHLNRGIYITLPEKKVFLYEFCREQYLHNMALFRDACAARIGNAPLKLCIENTEGWDQPYLRDTVALLLQSPQFALTLDTGHSCGQEVLARRNQICHMHLHDAAGNACHLPLGTGSLDIAAYITLANAQSCRAVLEIKTVDALRDSVQYLKERDLL